MRTWRKPLDRGSGPKTSSSNGRSTTPQKGLLAAECHQAVVPILIKLSLVATTTYNQYPKPILSSTSSATSSRKSYLIFILPNSHHSGTCRTESVLQYHLVATAGEGLWPFWLTVREPVTLGSRTGNSICREQSGTLMAKRGRIFLE
jgi:hypothetical protein